ncbi:hypothetical protein FHX08_005201 [Rhizobium sp. BK529]|uniref:TraH family protein n=1 Tax=Rhizobium sp. BK529 TaxID=2586983 RepID=UPI00161E3C68|nr:TraH family protein [Rhizobium sp. BK529]MBB3594791.1 hypothetical protein [Rhizobium sp. BK529]
MLDPALLDQCADPSLKPAVVEQFVEAAGSSDPLALAVQSGGRLILVPTPKSPDEALGIVREYAGKAIVRVGITQFPAGVGAKDATELKPDLVEPCGNLRMGTAMFAKVLRIVSKWYGNPKSEEAFAQIFEDAIHAWRTARFEGLNVFRAEDPGGTLDAQPNNVVPSETAATSDQPTEPPMPSQAKAKAQDAGIRIDLSRIGSN